MTMVAELDEAGLRQFQAQAEQMLAGVPAENQDMAEALLQIIRDRLESLGGGQ